MQPLKKSLIRSTLTLGLLSAMLFGAVPAFADNTVTQGITGRARAASVASLNLTSVAFSHVGQDNPGTMTLTVDDSTGSGAGWNVTVIASGFIYAGPNAGATIASANFFVTAANTPVSTAGQAVTAGGPRVPATSPLGALDTARKVIQADAAAGTGTYTQTIPVRLTIPADASVGTYTATLTTTIIAAP